MSAIASLSNQFGLGAAGATPFAKSPTQANDIYAQRGNYAKQKHLFLVRFNRNGISAIAPYAGLQQALGAAVSSIGFAQSLSSSTAPTFAIKAVERPKVAPRNEEVNQYNKKRQIYTGNKLEPVRVTFYDSGDGAAHLLWQAYANYYFGDFGPNNLMQYRYDATLPWNVGSGGGMADGGNYGFTALNGGQQTNESQFYFQSIDILHFYNNVYETYSLINPRIIGYDPDELDYQNSEISIITMQFSYEAIAYKNASLLMAPAPELQPGGEFNGNLLPVVTNSSTVSPLAGNSILSALATGVFNGTTQTALTGLLTGAPPTVNLGNAGLFGSNPTSNSLLPYGNFNFGVPNTNTTASGTDLLALAQGNPQLATILAGVPSNFLGVSTSIPYAVSQAGAASAPAAIANVLNGGAGAAGSAIGNTISQAGLAASVANGITVRPNVTATGVSLPDSTYSMMNVQSNGSVQYGVNLNTPGSGPGFTMPMLGGTPTMPTPPAGGYTILGNLVPADNVPPPQPTGF